MWSLAVEEQFYLVFPLLVAIVPRRWLWAAIGALCLIFTAVRLLGGYALCDGLYLTDGRTEARVIAILLGAWLALVRADLIPRPRWRFAALLAGWVALLLLLGGRAGYLDAVGVGGSLAAVWLAVTGRAAWRQRALAWFGLRCYGLYLLHVPALFFVDAVAPGLRTVFFAPIWLAVVLAAAALSYRYLERPIIEAAARRLGRRPEEVADGLAVSAGTVVVPVAAIPPG